MQLKFFNVHLVLADIAEKESYMIMFLDKYPKLN